MATATLIQIHPKDNVGVLPRSLVAGDMIEVNGERVVLDEAIGLGHKFALQPMAEGDKVLKYGVSIGSTTQAVGLGEHLHLHNMQSDYLPTYTLEEERKFDA